MHPLRYKRLCMITVGTMFLRGHLDSTTSEMGLQNVPAPIPPLYVDVSKRAVRRLVHEQISLNTLARPRVS